MSETIHALQLIGILLKFEDHINIFDKQIDISKAYLEFSIHVKYHSE